MKNILTLITFTSYSLLGTSLINSFDQYRMTANSDYPWYQYNNLDNNIFDNSFVGTDQLSSLLTDMVIIIVLLFIIVVYCCLLLLFIVVVYCCCLFR